MKTTPSFSGGSRAGWAFTLIELLVVIAIIAILASLRLTWFALPARAADHPLQHRLMFFEYGHGPNRLLELDAGGKVIWEHKPPSLAVIFEVLPNGHVLYAYGGKPTGMREVTRQGEEVWNYAKLNLTWVSSLQQLPNGHLLVGNFLRCQEGKGAHAFEVTRNKKVVWKWNEHSIIKSLTTVRALD